MDNLSLSDIASVTGNKDGFLEGNGIIILILFFLIFGFGGGAWGNNQQGTQAEVQRGFDTQAIINKLDGISNGICSSSYENAQLINQMNVNQMEQCCCNLKTQMMQDKYDALKTQYDQSLQAISNSVQTHNILSQLGRYYTNPPYCPQYGTYYPAGATVA